MMRTPSKFEQVEKLYAGLQSAQFLYPLGAEDEDDDQEIFTEDGIPFGEPAVRVWCRNVRIRHSNGDDLRTFFCDAYNFVADASTITGKGMGNKWPNPAFAENTRIEVLTDLPEQGDGFHDIEMLIDANTPVVVRIIEIRPHVDRTLEIPDSVVTAENHEHNLVLA